MAVCRSQPCICQTCGVFCRKILEKPILKVVYFPAIFGTVLMVLLMSVIVTPFGVIAAVYLREYAKQGPLGPHHTRCGKQSRRCPIYRVRRFWIGIFRLFPWGQY